MTELSALEMFVLSAFQLNYSICQNYVEKIVFFLDSDGANSHITLSKLLFFLPCVIHCLILINTDTLTSNTVQMQHVHALQFVRRLLKS